MQMAWIERHKAVRWRVALLPIAFCLIILAACDAKNASVDSKFVDLFIEIRAMEQTLGTETPEARLARVNIIESYGFTLSSYEKAVDDLLEDSERWVPFQQAVVARIDTLLSNPGLLKTKKAPTVENAGDAATKTSTDKIATKARKADDADKPKDAEAPAKAEQEAAK